MKISSQHYNEMKSAIDKVLKARPKLKPTGKESHFSNVSIAFNILHTSGYNTHHLYTYLNDTHVQTALFKIIGLKKT